MEPGQLYPGTHVIMLGVMERVLVIGCSGAGKSTLSRVLGQRLGLPVVHLDREYWRPGWRSIPDAEFERRVAEVVERPRWVIDGNFARTLPLRLTRADTAIHLDFPRWRCLYRVTRRVVRAKVLDEARPDMSDGCEERWDWEFVEWVWNFRAESRPQTVGALERRPEGVKLVTLRTPAAVKRFVAGLPGVPVAAGR
jgi:adenylate kinase family enzyme